MKEQIQFMKTYRELIQMDGDFYRLRSPFEGNDAAWMVVSQDQTKAIVGYYQCLNRVNASWMWLKLLGLQENMFYEISWNTEPGYEIDAKLEMVYGFHEGMLPARTYRAYGSELMYGGIPIDRRELVKKGGDFASLVYVVKQVEI